MIPMPRPRTCRCPCCKRLFKSEVTHVTVLNRARRNFDWPELLCIDCLGDPQAGPDGKCPHALAENGEREAR